MNKPFQPLYSKVRSISVDLGQALYFVVFLLSCSLFRFCLVPCIFTLFLCIFFFLIITYICAPSGDLKQQLKEAILPVDSANLNVREYLDLTT